MLLLIRHGQTDWNIEDRIQGHTNNPLNKKGIAQAEGLAEKIALTYPDITAIYSSDLDRAFATAQITGERLHLQVEKREQLRERNNGAAEGLTAEEERVLYGASEEMLNQLYLDYQQRWEHTSIPGAETYNELLKRVRRELTDIAMKHPGEQVAVFAHGEIFGIFISDLLGKEELLHLPNCSVVKTLYLPEDSMHPFKFVAIDEPVITETAGASMKHNLESVSEKNGINLLSTTDRKIYSVGISTGGLAEIKMAQSDRQREIVATTIDAAGAEYAKQRIEEMGLSVQIEVKIEDVSQSLSYPDDYFDYIYARLVLHYLPKDALISALSELHRILRTGGKMFVVVRSVDCPEACDKAAKFDALTGLTTYTSGGKSHSRYFHSQESIKHYLSLAGLTIRHIHAYQEQLCIDFHRTQLSNQIDSLIEVLAIK